MNGGIDLDTDTIKVALVTSGYTPNQDTDDNWDDVVPASNEIVGTGYTAGGATLSSVTVTVDNTDNEGVFDAADVSWVASTITNARGAVIYKSTGTASTSKLICYLDFGSDKSTSNGTFQITFNSEGILNLS
jgi:hypothetical protein